MTPAESELVEASLAFLPHMAEDGMVVVRRLPEGLQERWVRATRSVWAERTERCECLDWTQVGHPSSAYWPDMHPNYHHPDCQKYTRPPPYFGARPVFAESDDRCGAADCQGPKRCEEPGCEVPHPNACSSDSRADGWRCHKHPATRLEDLPKAALVRMAEGARVGSRGRQRFQVWEACVRLRDLRDAIPMVKVLLDYLEPPRETHDGKSGWWHECLVCGADYFYSAGAHGMLCPRCAGARYYEIHLGFDRKAGALAWGPERLGLYVLPGAESDVAQHLRDVAAYLDGGA